MLFRYYRFSSQWKLNAIQHDNVLFRDVSKLYDIGLAAPTHVGTVQAHQSVHASSRVPSPIITRTPAVSVNNQYKASATTVMPVQVSTVRTSIL